MLTHDRRVLDVPLEERLRSRTSELLACVKTILYVINQGVRDARARLHTDHQDIRTDFFEATVAAAMATPPVTASVTSPARANGLSLDIRQRFQRARSDGSFLVATAPLKSIG
jgi:hypothetical protein